jgi:polar amino acid transport system permease protein
LTKDPKKKMRITLPDAVTLAALAGVVGYVLYRAIVGLNYHWHWESIPQFILWYDTADNAWRTGPLVQGLLTTLRLSLWAGVLATGAGIVMGLFRVSPGLFKRQLAGTYVGLIRNTPPLVLIFIFYFFIGDQIMSLLRVENFIAGLSESVRSALAWPFGPMNRFPQFLSAVLTLALFEGAYIAEIVRAGVQSVETGQWEAASGTGLSRMQAMRYVILPQALQRMLPALAGQFISIIKDSAIVSVISIEELTFQGQQIMTTTYMSFEVWITVFVMYFLLTFLCSAAVRRLELTLRR